MWSIKFKPHSRFTLPCCIFPMLIAGVYSNFPKQNTRYSYIFPKLCIERQLSSMVKSASIVRNLSKIHTFRTIASILIDTQSRFPVNLTILIIQLQEARIKPIGYNDNVIRPQLYPNGIILALHSVTYIGYISQNYPQNI